LLNQNDAIVRAIALLHHPGVDRDGLLNVLVVAVRDADVAACPVEVESITDLAVGKASSAN
jgi:hypothetical protein